MSYIAPDEAQRMAIFLDAAEAYIGSLKAPQEVLGDVFERMENRIEAICAPFELGFPMLSTELR